METIATNPLDRLRRRFASDGREYDYYSLPALGEEMGLPIKRLPVSIRIMLESVLRNCDGKFISEQDVENLAYWGLRPPAEVPFKVSRVLLQDFTGIPLLADLAAMRAVVHELGKDPAAVEPLVPVDLVVDHSVQVNVGGIPEAMTINMEIEHQRNQERYSFLKWGQHAFKNFNVIPAGIGICHQVNLEYLGRCVMSQPVDGLTIAYPDTLVGADSHTTMINGLGILGWGVGGIEAKSAMLGQPVYLLTPEVVGFHLEGQLRANVTGTDLVLTITEILRKHKVVGKFVEFFGEGAAALTVQERATIANMAPEYGATCGFWPVDEKTLSYLRLTGRTAKHIQWVHDYYAAQGMFGIPRKGEVDYTEIIHLDLGEVEACVSGPKRPQDRIPLTQLKEKFLQLLTQPIPVGYGRSTTETREVSVRLRPKPSDLTLNDSDAGGSQEPLPVQTAQDKNTSHVTEMEMANNRPTPDPVSAAIAEPSVHETVEIRDGTVVIAAITSCTNTSNHLVMLAAGLLARNAVKRGLRVHPFVKTSLAPGSRAVTDYLRSTGLDAYLDALGFNLVGYGCTTCIGNSGPLAEEIESALTRHDIIAASVLSGNRNFEGRVHSLVKSNFLMSPPLVVAFALAGRVDINLNTEPLAYDSQGRPVMLRDLWPAPEEISATAEKALNPDDFKKVYARLSTHNPMWDQINAPAGILYEWQPESTYIQKPPFFEQFTVQPGPPEMLQGMRALAIFGDFITTDHISPAGSIKKDSPAGQYLIRLGVSEREFNSYGARRGNHEVMIRGAFANLRIRNLMLPGKEGGFTRNVLDDSREPLWIFDAAQNYQRHGVPLIIFAGKEYGAGSSRDWAAKSTRLLGVKAVISESFERIHRGNLVGMGVLPCNFEPGTNSQTLQLDGSEIFTIHGLDGSIEPRRKLRLEIRRANGPIDTVPILARLDSPIEIEYYRHGGILPYMLRQLLAR